MSLFSIKLFLDKYTVVSLFFVKFDKIICLLICFYILKFQTKLLTDYL